MNLENIYKNNKKIIGFGASINKKFLKIKFDYFVDNNPKLHGKKIYNKKIYNPSILLNEKNFLIIILSTRFIEIKKKLNELGIKKNIKHFLDFEDDLLSKIGDPDMDTLKRIIKKNDYIFDIGANVGTVTYKFSQLTPYGKVFSFEPEKNCYKNILYLKKKLNLNNVKVINKAISNDKKKVATLKTPIINSVEMPGYQFIDYRSNTIKPNNINALNARNNKIFRKSLIELVSLDEFIKKNKIEKVEFIKVDTEGNEYKVLLSAINTIEKFKPKLLIERYSNDEFDKIVNLLSKFGYEVFHFFRNKIIKSKYTKNNFSNFLFKINSK